MPSTRESGATVDTDAWITVRSVDDFARLRKNQLESTRHWWPDMGPVRGTSSFSFTHRVRRLGPITVLDIDFHDEAWVNGGEIRPHYHVTMPVATSSTALQSTVAVDSLSGSIGVYRPEGKAGVSGYVGRLLAVMIDRYAVEAALADSVGRTITSQIDFHPIMQSPTHAVRNWTSMVSVFTQQLFLPGSVLHHPMVGMPFVDSLIRGLLVATDHSYRASLHDEAAEPTPGAIRMAVDVIEAEADQPLTVSTLAERSYISVRSLQQGFQRHLGTSPMAYLREVRLRRAHQNLLESDPSAVTVASVASRWGFSNLGRFAAAHNARYRETPLKTLRRNVF